MSVEDDLHFKLDGRRRFLQNSIERLAMRGERVLVGVRANLTHDIGAVRAAGRRIGPARPSRWRVLDAAGSSLLAAASLAFAAVDLWSAGVIGGGPASISNWVLAAFVVAMLGFARAMYDFRLMTARSRRRRAEREEAEAALRELTACLRHIDEALRTLQPRIDLRERPPDRTET